MDVLIKLSSPLFVFFAITLAWNQSALASGPKEIRDCRELLISQNTRKLVDPSVESLIATYLLNYAANENPKRSFLKTDRPDFRAFVVPHQSAMAWLRLAETLLWPLDRRGFDNDWTYEEKYDVRTTKTVYRLSPADDQIVVIFFIDQTTGAPLVQLFNLSAKKASISKVVGTNSVPNPPKDTIDMSRLANPGPFSQMSQAMTDVSRWYGINVFDSRENMFRSENLGFRALSNLLNGSQEISITAYH